MLSLALAVSYHLNGEAYNFNSVHPHVRYTTESGYIAGGYYNSEYTTSVYVGRSFDVYGYFNLDVAAVTGYKYTVVPYLRVEKNGFFVAPTIYHNTELGAVVGYEWSFDTVW